ncbi:MAG: hypothetical protein PGN11_19470 [Quadrisphaera sp.]
MPGASALPWQNTTGTSSVLASLTTGVVPAARSRASTAASPSSPSAASWEASASTSTTSPVSRALKLTVSPSRWSSSSRPWETARTMASSPVPAPRPLETGVNSCPAPPGERSEASKPAASAGTSTCSPVRHRTAGTQSSGWSAP